MSLLNRSNLQPKISCESRLQAALKGAAFLFALTYFDHCPLVVQITVKKINSKIFKITIAFIGNTNIMGAERR
jgi:hypothetical protein